MNIPTKNGKLPTWEELVAPMTMLNARSQCFSAKRKIELRICLFN